MEVLDDSPCNGVCRMETIDNEVKCKSCFRTYQDLEQWFYMTKEQRLQRMKQLRLKKLKTQ